LKCLNFIAGKTYQYKKLRILKSQISVSYKITNQVKKITKVKTGWKLPLLPLPVCLLGAHIEDKPNFNTIVWFNMLLVKKTELKYNLN